jgi:hypothetical protein
MKAIWMTASPTARRKHYWWSIVMLLRPTVIAVVVNARDRGTGTMSPRG